MPARHLPRKAGSCLRSAHRPWPRGCGPASLGRRRRLRVNRRDRPDDDAASRMSGPDTADRVLGGWVALGPFPPSLRGAFGPRQSRVACATLDCFASLAMTVTWILFSRHPAWLTRASFARVLP